MCYPAAAELRTSQAARARVFLVKPLQRLAPQALLQRETIQSLSLSRRASRARPNERPPKRATGPPHGERENFAAGKFWIGMPETAMGSIFGWANAVDQGGGKKVYVFGQQQVLTQAGMVISVR